MATTKKLLPLSELILNAFKRIKINWLAILLIIIFISLLITIATIIWTVVYTLIVYIGLIPFGNIIILSVIINLLASITSFIITVLAQILLFNKLLNTQISFKENLKAIKTYFWTFLWLGVLVYILVIIASLPLYATIILVLLNSFALSLFAVIFSFVLFILLGTYTVFSPFILFENNQGSVTALKQSVEMAKNNFWNILYRIAAVSIIVIIINGISLLFIYHSFTGAFIGIVLIILLIIFMYNFFTLMYLDFKKIKNA